MYPIDHGVLIAFLAGRPIGLVQQSSRGLLTLCQKSSGLRFFFNQLGGTSAPTIVLKDRDAKALAAHVVPYKGGTWSGQSNKLEGISSSGEFEVTLF